jgi:hypothetical protein
MIEFGFHITHESEIPGKNGSAVEKYSGNTCEGEAPDFEIDPATDALLCERAQTRGRKPTAADWEILRKMT